MIFQRARGRKFSSERQRQKSVQVITQNYRSDSCHIWHILSLVLISRRPTCDVVSGCNLQRSAICPSGSPAHLRWIPAYSNMREMQIELAHFSTVSLVIWIEWSYWSSSFRLLSSLLEKMRTRRKSWVRAMLQGRTNHDQ